MQLLVVKWSPRVIRWILSMWCNYDFSTWEDWLLRQLHPITPDTFFRGENDYYNDRFTAERLAYVSTVIPTRNSLGLPRFFDRDEEEDMDEDMEDELGQSRIPTWTF